MSRRAFTLIEALVVMGILGLLAALVFGLMAPAREKGRRAVCAGNLRHWGQAYRMYAQDWERSMHIMVSQRGPRDDWHLPLCNAILETMAARPEPGHEKQWQYDRFEALGKEMGLPGRVRLDYTLVRW